MSAAEAELLRLPLRCDRKAPARAREAIRGLRAMVGARDDAVLLASELVSRAVLAQGFAPDHTIELTASQGPQGLHIAVATGARGAASQPEPMVAWVVGALARRWGVERGAGRVELWAELTV